MLMNPPSPLEDFIFPILQDLLRGDTVVPTFIHYLKVQLGGAKGFDPHTTPVTLVSI
jgi:hypothetical protein